MKNDNFASNNIVNWDNDKHFDFPEKLRNYRDAVCYYEKFMKEFKNKNKQTNRGKLFGMLKREFNKYSEEKTTVITNIEDAKEMFFIDLSYLMWGVFNTKTIKVKSLYYVFYFWDELDKYKSGKISANKNYKNNGKYFEVSKNLKEFYPECENIIQAFGQVTKLHKEKYYHMNHIDFLQTPYWKTITRYMKYIKGRCEECGSIENLETHYKTYQNRGHEYENLDDLQVLCSNCHQKKHIN